MNQAALALSMYLTASPTVTMDSAASSGISMPNSSSNAMTSSTVSRLSAPRYSMKDAVSKTLSASTFRCSTTIFFTRSAVSLMVLKASPRWPGGVGVEGPPRYARLIMLLWGAGFVTQSPAARYKTVKYLKLLLDHRHSAVDLDRFAGHIGCFVARPIDHGGGEF